MLQINERRKVSQVIIFAWTKILLLNIPLTPYFLLCSSKLSSVTLAVTVVTKCTQLISNIFLKNFSCNLTVMMFHPCFSNSQKNLLHSCEFTIFKTHKYVLFPPGSLSVNFFLLKCSWDFSKSNSILSFSFSSLKCLLSICQLIASNVNPDVKGQSNSLLHKTETSDYETAKWHCLLSFAQVHANSWVLGSVFQEDFDAYLAFKSWTC